MGDFCEQFELPLIVHSRKKRKKPDKVLKKKHAPYYNNYKKRRFNKPSTSNNFSKKSKKPKKKRESKFDKYADKCLKPFKNIKQEINALNISDSEKENIFRIFQNNAFSDFSSDEDFLTSDDSEYHSISEFSEDVKIGCFDSCYKETKTCYLISKIENPELKEEYLKKLKKTMIKDIHNPSKSKISFDESLERFSKQKSEVVTISDLQHEISNIKKYIIDLKKDVHDLKINNKNLEQELLISKAKDCFQEHNFDIEDSTSEHSDEAQFNNMLSNDAKIISLLNKVCPPKWYAKVYIVVTQYYAFNVIALIDSSVDLNCIQEGLILGKYFENSLND